MINMTVNITIKWLSWLYQIHHRIDKVHEINMTIIIICKCVISICILATKNYLTYVLEKIELRFILYFKLQSFIK